MGTRDGGGSGGILGWWDKSDEEDQQEECDVGLGLRMQLNDHSYSNSDTTASSSSSSVFPTRKAPHPYHHYLTGEYVGGGSVYGNTGKVDDQVSYVGLGEAVFTAPDCFSSGGSSATKTAKSLHHQQHQHQQQQHPLSISGKMGLASGNVRVPFTAAQWQELERQNMILKYIMASVPVPPELLLPISASTTTKSFSNLVPPSRGGGDPEPWRCRRTDGKKWRCSRDVAPHQKYCERHSHKNRPRSRKPVELPSVAAAADYLLNPAAKPSSAAKRSIACQPQHRQPPPFHSRQPPSSHFIAPFDQDTPSCFASSQPFDQPRY